MRKPLSPAPVISNPGFAAGCNSKKLTSLILEIRQKVQAGNLPRFRIVYPVRSISLAVKMICIIKNNNFGRL
ncbi:MAG TPA: hypothetical protein DF409_03145 [Bacteroidales bacterium]|nr:hypothetical protein [Bacteroidales bacterium]